MMRCEPRPGMRHKVLFLRWTGPGARFKREPPWDDLLSRCRNQLYFNIRCAGWSNIYGRAQFFVFAEKVGIHVGESLKIFPGEEFVFPGYSRKERETATLICKRRSVQVAAFALTCRDEHNLNAGNRLVATVDNCAFNVSSIAPEYKLEALCRSRRALDYI